MTSAYVLVIALLTVQSSYLRDVEEPRGTIPDTVQFWYSPNSHWRIKTFAMDHDIHVHEIRKKGTDQSYSVEQAKANTERNYGDVLDRLLVIEIADPTDSDAVTRILRAHGLPGSLEVGKSGVAFYNPDGGRYHSQSRPE